VAGLLLATPLLPGAMITSALARVAEVIERVSGVSYHPRHVWRILREQLGWTWQRPARRATERNDEAIHQWVKGRWPQVKKGRGASTR
jgi:transposase